MTISLDSKYQEIDRTVFTLGDLFGKIGGVDSILWMIASFLVGIFTPTIYNASLISDLYSVLKRQNNFDLQVMQISLNLSNLLYFTHNNLGPVSSRVARRGRKMTWPAYRKFTENNQGTDTYDAKIK